MSLPEIVVTVNELSGIVVVEDGVIVLPAPQPDAYAHRMTMTAGENLSGHRAVVTVDGQAFYADNQTIAHAGQLAGLTLGAALAGDSVTVQALGLITEPGWNWTPGAIWLGASGVLTQSLPATGMQWRLGTALTATTVLWEPLMPIVQTEIGN